MRNRAKCKLCGDVLESFHRYDYVTCQCGEISISGGQYAVETGARDYDNFLRLDDLDNEIPVKVVPKPGAESLEKMPLNDKKECIEALERLLHAFENLPMHAWQDPVTHYDLYSFMLLVVAVFKKDT